MFVRAAAVLTAMTFAAPAFAEPLNAETARHFVAGKLFSFTCFEGTTGSGRIFADGSVAGVVRMSGGNTRFMHLPPGTLYAKNEGICSNMKGALLNPCFDLNRTSDKSFRGAISGLSFAYCDFVRGGNAREMIASVIPSEKPSSTGPSIRHGRKASKDGPATTGSIKAPAAAAPANAPAATPAPTTAAPVAPVTAAPVAPVERAEIRSSISP
jgi:hypothetical protein